MSKESCIPFQENLAAYALGALDADEIPAIEAHLKTCADCQAELADYEQVRTGLLQAVPPRMPPADLRQKLAARLPSAQKRTPPLLERLFGAFSLAKAVASAALVLMFGLIVMLDFQLRLLQQQQSALLTRQEAQQAAVAMLAYPQTQVLAVQPDVQELAGTLLVDKDKNAAVLVLWNLPALPGGQTYQVWLIDASGGRTSGGLFLPAGEARYTTATIQSPIPLGQFTGVGVTIEPQGGSDGPTGPRVLRVDL